MKVYAHLNAEDYLELTNRIREIVDRTREPSTQYDEAFISGYDGHMMNTPFLKIYTQYLTQNSKPTVKDLHALCLGYGTAGSVIDALAEEENNNDSSYH